MMHNSSPPWGFFQRLNPWQYSSTLATSGCSNTRLTQALLIGPPMSIDSTSAAPTQRSARVWSIGSEVTDNRPNSSPHCSAIRTALNATASIPGR
jgi:hypothetical protein